MYWRCRLMIDNKNKTFSIEELDKRLLEKYRENKYIIDDHYEEELYNKISIVYNYRFNTENREDIVNKTNLYTQLALYILNDFILYVLQNINKYISKKHQIEDFRLNQKRNYEVYSDFINELQNITDTKEEKLIKWTYLSCLNEITQMESTLFIVEEDQLIRFEKITSNTKRKLKSLEESIENEEYVIALIQNFYEYRDKLKKNKFIGKKNRVRKNILKAISKDNDEWTVSKDKTEIKRIVQYEEERYIEKSIVKFQRQEFKEGKGYKKRIQKNIILNKGE